MSASSEPRLYPTPAWKEDAPAETSSAEEVAIGPAPPSGKLRPHGGESQTKIPLSRQHSLLIQLAVLGAGICLLLLLAGQANSLMTARLETASGDVTPGPLASGVVSPSRLLLARMVLSMTVGLLVSGVLALHRLLSADGGLPESATSGGGNALSSELAFRELRLRLTPLIGSLAGLAGGWLAELIAWPGTVAVLSPSLALPSAVCGLAAARYWLEASGTKAPAANL